MRDLLVDYWLKITRLIKPENDGVQHIYALYHYTDCNGLEGILDKDGLKFWFSRSDCLNDTSELKYIEKLYKDACFELCNNGISKEFYNLIKDLKPKREKMLLDLSSNNLSSCKKLETYICSFSLKEDSLDMWRYYSNGSKGCSLKIDGRICNELTKEQRLKQYIDKRKIIYDKKEQMAILKECIETGHKAYEYCKTKENIQSVLVLIQQVLNTYQYIFKNECFSSENEFRFIFNYPKNVEIDYLPEVKIRHSHDVDVPYIELYFNDFLEEVMISPLVKDENVVERTLDFVRSRGFNNKIIKQSELPVRF